MKLKNLFFVALMALPFYARGGAGAHGGEIVDIDGQYFPRDIVEQAKCDTWRTGSEMIERVPETKQLFERLAKVDWYFALDLERELRSLSFCLTGPLKPIKIDERNQPQIPTDAPSIFTGLRHNNDVLLDQKHFFSPQLAGIYRALFLVHETVHSYISNDLDPAERRLDVFTMVHAINDIRRGALTSRETFHLIMQKSNVDFPTTVSELDPYRTQIEFVLGDSNKKREMVDSATNLDVFVRGNYASMAPYVADWDRDAIQMSPAAAIESAYKAVILDGTDDEIDHALNATDSKYVSAGLVALGEYTDLPPSLQSKVQRIADIGSLIPPVLRHMTESGAYICDLNVCANTTLQEWAGLTSSTGEMHAMNLATGQSDESLDWKAVTNALVILAQNNQWSSIDQIVNYPLFAEALTLTNAKGAMNALKAPIPREVMYSQEAVSQVSKRMIARLKATLEANLDADAAARIENLLPKN